MTAIFIQLYLTIYLIIQHIDVIAGNAKQPSILSQMIAEAHEIREKQSAHRAHVINNVAIKSQNQTEDSVFTFYFSFLLFF